MISRVGQGVPKNRVTEVVIEKIMDKLRNNNPDMMKKIISPEVFETVLDVFKKGDEAKVSYIVEQGKLEREFVSSFFRSGKNPVEFYQTSGVKYWDDFMNICKNILKK